MNVSWMPFLVTGPLCNMGVAREKGRLMGGGKGWSKGAPWGVDCSCEVEMGNGGVVEVELQSGGMKKAGGIKVVCIGLLTFGISTHRGGVRDVCGNDVVDARIGIGTMVEATNVAWFSNIGAVTIGHGTIVDVIFGVLICFKLCFQAS